VKRQDDPLLDVVKPIAKRFDLGGVGGLGYFQEFFERPHRFAGSFAGGDHDAGDIIAGLFARGFNGCADIAGRIAMKDRLPEKGPEGLRHFMAQIFYFAAEGVTVENKTGIVFQHAEGFAGAVRIGVD
jgi:hypothetical protein